MGDTSAEGRASSPWTRIVALRTRIVPAHKKAAALRFRGRCGCYVWKRASPFHFPRTPALDARRRPQHRPRLRRALQRSPPDEARYLVAARKYRPALFREVAAQEHVTDTLNSFSQFTIGGNTESNPLPIELASFEATAEADDRTVLTWQTTSETNNEGFHIERSTSGPEGDFEKIGFRKGAGTTTGAHIYRFTDEDVPFEAKKLTYRLRQEDRDGSVQYSKPVEVEVRGSSELALHGTFPNPFQEQATVRYSVPERTHVRLAVYDALGRRVRTLVDEQQEGRQETSFRAQDLSSGTYFYRLEAGGRVLTESVVLVR